MIDEAEFRAAVAEGPPDPERFTVLTRREFEELPEYSTSIPTGKKPGKRWKRDLNTLPPARKWMIGEYVDVGSTTEIGIRWTWPLIV